jgi:F0F1-type ATP synthase assembly protein I
MEPDGDTDRDAGTEPASRPQSANMGIAFDLGIRLGVSVIVGLGGGLLLDSWLHTSPIFTLIGMALGIGAAMYTIWDVARDAMRK